MIDDMTLPPVRMAGHLPKFVLDGQRTTIPGRGRITSVPVVRVCVVLVMVVSRIRRPGTRHQQRRNRQRDTWCASTFQVRDFRDRPLLQVIAPVSKRQSTTRKA
jgi:hypothetical protein